MKNNATQNRSPIALSDGKLLIRDQSRLMCVKVANELHFKKQWF
jgi:hypothetical protein